MYYLIFYDITLVKINYNAHGVNSKMDQTILRKVNWGRMGKIGTHMKCSNMSYAASFPLLENFKEGGVKNEQNKVVESVRKTNHHR